MERRGRTLKEDLSFEVGERVYHVDLILWYRLYIMESSSTRAKNYPLENIVSVFESMRVIWVRGSSLSHNLDIYITWYDHPSTQNTPPHPVIEEPRSHEYLLQRLRIPNIAFQSKRSFTYVIIRIERYSYQWSREKWSELVIFDAKEWTILSL